jgi:hypothetical protein
MIQSKYGEIIAQESDVIDMIMQGRDPLQMHGLTVSPDLDIDRLASELADPKDIVSWKYPETKDIDVNEFDAQRQKNWFMPDEYRSIDIAAHVLSLCRDQSELQRAGQELMMFQEQDLFDLLRYLKYLVDTMRANHIIWGVGRGSSVASFVLYLLGVHRINSIYYDLDPREFLR